MPPTRTPYAPPPDAPPDILHLDDALIAVNKPAGLLCVPGRGAEKADCLEARLRRLHPDALTVHRLDMETSGLVLYSRSPDAQRAMGRLFERRAVEKTYVALCAGEPDAETGEIDRPIAPDWPNRPLQRCDPDGKPALTRWRVLERAGDHARLALTPVTGRTHQLRVHLAAIGHPLLGDALYAPPEIRARRDRLALHAARLGFTHPATGARLDLASPAPF